MGSSGQCCKGFVGWSKDCERTWRAQRVCQISCYNSSNQSGQIFDRLGQLDNVGPGSWCRCHWAWQEDTINDVNNSVASQVICTDHLFVMLGIIFQKDALAKDEWNTQFLSFHSYD